MTLSYGSRRRFPVSVAVPRDGETTNGPLKRSLPARIGAPERSAIAGMTSEIVSGAEIA